MSIALEVHDLWKTYRIGIRGCSARVTVLCGVDLEVGRGERVGILGRPASGKTTLLHCIAGLRRPDAGAIQLHEQGAERFALLDEGRPIGASVHETPAATLIAGRELAWLRARVDRIVVLGGGLIVPLDPPAMPIAVGRRVAERSALAEGTRLR